MSLRRADVLGLGDNGREMGGSPLVVGSPFFGGFEGRQKKRESSLLFFGLGAGPQKRQTQIYLAWVVGDFKGKLSL